MAPALHGMLLGIAVFGSTVMGVTSSGHAAEGGVGGLLIAPTRVELGPRERSAELTLMNRGTKTGTYRLGLVEKRMTEDGQLESVPEGETTPSSAASMVRFSPRQVRLEPGSSQKVRLLVRRPGDLADGEYRSHLLIQTLPEPGEAPESEGTGGNGQLRVKLVTMTAVSIPVIVRQGPVSCAVAVTDVALTTWESGDVPPRVRFRLAREGAASAYGDVEVVYTPEGGGDPRPVGRLRGVALYTPNQGRWVDIPLTATASQLEAGTVNIAYRSPGDGNGKPLAVAELALP